MEDLVGCSAVEKQDKGVSNLERSPDPDLLEACSQHGHLRLHHGQMATEQISEAFVPAPTLLGTNQEVTGEATRSPFVFRLMLQRHDCDAT